MSKGKRKHRGLKAVWSLTAVLAIVLGVLIFWEQIVGKAKEGAAELAMGQIVEHANQIPQLQDVPVEEIYNSLEPEDKQTVKEILADNITLETVKEVKTYMDNQDIQGLQQYLQESLSDEEQAAIYELYEKYKDRIPH